MRRLHDRMDKAEGRLDGAIAYRALVRYDAYNEMSGQQSTSIALLDARALGRRARPRSTTATRHGCTPSTSARAQAELELSPEEDEAVRARARRARPRGLRARPMRVGYLGPAGTFSEEALRGAPSTPATSSCRCPRCPRPSWPSRTGGRPRAGADRERARGRGRRRPSTRWPSRPRTSRIVGEIVHPVHHCLIARGPAGDRGHHRRRLAPAGHRAVPPIPARRCPGAGLLAATSTAEAVRLVADDAGGPDAALGPRLAAERYGAGSCARASRTSRATRRASCGSRAARAPRARADAGPWKTSVVFWGAGAEAPGWLVRCLSEFAFRGVNLARIESRPRAGPRPLPVLRGPRRAGRRPRSRGASPACARQTEHVRVLGSYRRSRLTPEADTLAARHGRCSYHRAHRVRAAAGAPAARA